MTESEPKGHTDEPEETVAEGADSGDQMAKPEASEAPEDAVDASPETGDEDPVAALSAQVETLKDQLLRALAEVENTRRRAQRDREEALRYGPAGLARDFLAVADNLRRAIESVEPETAQSDSAVQSLLAGVELTEKELLKVFERHSVRKIDPQGERFDAHFHQAMFEVPDADAEPGTVVQVLQPGYALHDRLLRAAMVGVAKAPAAEPTKETADSES